MKWVRQRFVDQPHSLFPATSGEELLCPTGKGWGEGLRILQLPAEFHCPRAVLVRPGVVARKPDHGNDDPARHLHVVRRARLDLGNEVLRMLKGVGPLAPEVAIDRLLSGHPAQLLPKPESLVVAPLLR